MPDRLDVVLRAARAVVGDVERPAAVGVRAGRVQVVAGVGAALTADEEIVLGDDVVLLPGLVDTHVHLQDPGHPPGADADRRRPLDLADHGPRRPEHDVQRLIQQVRHRSARPGRS